MNVRMFQDEQTPGVSMRRRTSLRSSAGQCAGTAGKHAPLRVCGSNTIPTCAVCVRVPSSAARFAVPAEAAQRPEFSLSIDAVIDIEYETPEILQRNRPGEAGFRIDGSPDRRWS